MKIRSLSKHLQIASPSFIEVIKQLNQLFKAPVKKNKKKPPALLIADYDACFDILQHDLMFYRTPAVFDLKDGYVNGLSTLETKKLLLMHIALAFTLLYLKNNFDLTICNGSLNQSEARTKQLKLIAKHFQIKFDSRFLNELRKSQSSPKYKVKIINFHRINHPQKRMFFIDDLKTNVNAIQMAFPGVSACQFDYHSFVIGQKKLIIAIKDIANVMSDNGLNTILRLFLQLKIKTEKKNHNLSKLVDEASQKVFQKV